MNLDPRRLQRHLRDTYRATTQPTRVGPFTCYLHPSSAHEALNVAIPEEPPEGTRVRLDGAPDADEVEPAVALAALRSYMRAKGRAPRVELLAECHPALPTLLAEEGWVEDARMPLLACTHDSWVRLDPPADVRVEPLLPDSSWPLARSYLLVQREAYGLDMPIPERAPPGHWKALQIGVGILASVGDAPVGAAGLTPQEDGLCDVRGLSVAPAQRGRGIAAFLLSALARVAHETGAHAVLALPDTTDAVRLARKAGYRPAATILSFRSADAAAP